MKPSTRPRRCTPSHGGCGELFTLVRPMQKACSPKCAQLMAQHKNARTAERAAREDRKQTRAQLEALKGIPELKREAQREFNRYIRLRDRLAGHPCISSGKPLAWESKGITGSAVDAGHYRSTGAADHLRFDEDNCHAQSVHENRDRAGNAVAYRIGLIARIGLERVEALESDNGVAKWTKDGLRAIRDEYRRKANELEKQISR